MEVAQGSGDELDRIIFPFGYGFGIGHYTPSGRFDRAQTLLNLAGS